MPRYVQSNPVNLFDPSGNSSVAIGLLFGAINPLAGLAVGLGLIIAGGMIIEKASSTYEPKQSVAIPSSPPLCFTKPFTKEKLDEDIRTIIATAEAEKSKKNPVVFPANPYDLKPKGLIITTDIISKNGQVIKWSPPGMNKFVIFEWDEDYKQGPHYHVMEPEWKGKHLDGKHYRAGDIIPEPWATYFYNK